MHIYAYIYAHLWLDNEEMAYRSLFDKFIWERASIFKAIISSYLTIGISNECDINFGYQKIIGSPPV